MKSIGIGLLVAAATGVNLWSVPLFGVPLTVVGMAVLGASLGAAYGTPLEKRRDLFITVAAHAFLASVLVGTAPAMMGLEWLKPEIYAPFAGLLAFAAKFALPIIPWGDMIRKVLRLEPKRNDND